ncbi:MAG: RNA-binding protein [Nitrososphaerota archaeon]|nr:KH domain-containing protein [Nitrososphaerota archaeon]MDG6926914.1 RNA-binding protein [Nitrososphaerota archaeon]MDG6929968.1 RNA-binding protein [Nitrososphaerota archaeon]
MEFERVLRVSKDRLGVIIGSGGSQKAFIEKTFKVKVTFNGGLVKIESSDNKSDPVTATAYIEALARGFSPYSASDLIDGRAVMMELDLRDYVSTKNSLVRIRGRLIGTNGSARSKIEQLTETKISIYGDHVSIIGKPDNVKLSADAVKDLIMGSRHASVFAKLERHRSTMKKDRLKLWETGV